MKAIDKLIEKYKKVFLVNELEVVQDLEQLKEQLNSDPIKEAFDNIPLENELRITKLLIKDLAEENKQLKEQHKAEMIEFHVAVMEKGLESEASEYKKSEWDRLVRHQAEQYYQQTHEKK